MNFDKPNPKQYTPNIRNSSKLGDMILMLDTDAYGPLSDIEREKIRKNVNSLDSREWELGDLAKLNEENVFTQDNFFENLYFDDLYTPADQLVADKSMLVYNSSTYEWEKSTYPQDHINFYNGSFLETFRFLITESGGTITGSLTNGNDPGTALTARFSDGYTAIPEGGVTLTAGTVTDPQFQFVYIPIATKLLTVSTSDWPATEHIKIATVGLRSAITTQTDGALMNANWNDHTGLTADSMGHSLHMSERLRQAFGSWYSGCEANLSIVGAAPSAVDLAVTGGKVFQLHKQDFDAMDTGSGGDVHVVNDPLSAYLTITDIEDIILDALGVTLVNRYFTIVVWGINNSSTQPDHVMINLPGGSYNNAVTALADTSGYNVYDIPTEYRNTGFLIAQFTCHQGPTGTWTLWNYTDLRGIQPNTSAGSITGSSGVTSFLGLTDTPSAYTSQANKIPQVNAGETALEFTDNPLLAGVDIGAAAPSANDLLYIYESDASHDTQVVIENAGAGSVGISFEGATYDWAIGHNQGDTSFRIVPQNSLDASDGFSFFRDVGDNDLQFIVESKKEAKVILDSDIDGVAADFSAIILRDAGTDRYGIWMDTTDDFAIYSYITSAFVFKADDSGLTYVRGTGEVRLWPDGDVNFLPITGNITFNPTVGNTQIYSNVGVGRSPTTLVDIYAAAADATLKIDSNTDDALLKLVSGSDGTTEVSYISFDDAGSAKWAIQKDASNDFVIYDYTGAQAALTIVDNGNMTLSPKGGATFVTGSLDVSTTLTVDTIQDSSGGNLTISPTGDIVFDPTGNDLMPNTGYDLNLGAINKKYLTLHAAELWVETLVAADTMATIGGRVLIGPTTQLIADLGSGDATMDVKHNQMTNGDRVLMEANGKLEFMAITSAAGAISGGYRYSITRNLDGTGANDWYAGDAVFNTGTTGNGFIDLYSLAGVVAGSTAGPTIVGNVRNSGTYNDYTERWGIGNLNGLWDYGGDTYGAAFGSQAAGQTWIGIDDTNGIRLMNNATQLGHWDLSGNLSLGEVATDQGNVFWNTSNKRMEFRGSTNGTVVQAYVDTDGSIVAGGGSVTLNSTGILLSSGSATADRVNWYDAANDFFPGSIEVDTLGSPAEAILQLRVRNDGVAGDSPLIALYSDNNVVDINADLFYVSNVDNTTERLELKFDSDYTWLYTTSTNGFYIPEDTWIASADLKVTGDTELQTLDLVEGQLALLIGADNTLNTRTNNTAKYGRFASYHYTNAEEPVGILIAGSDASNNFVDFGGGSGVFNAATLLRFYTAANQTTTTGTETFRIENTEVKSHVQLTSDKQMVWTREGLTISGGIVTATRSYHTIDTQSGAGSDELDTINGGISGQVLVLQAANSTRTIVCKDGTGNLRLAGDFSLTHTEDTITLIYAPSAWRELSRSDNGT